MKSEWANLYRSSAQIAPCKLFRLDEIECVLAGIGSYAVSFIEASKIASVVAAFKLPGVPSLRVASMCVVNIFSANKRCSFENLVNRWWALSNCAANARAGNLIFIEILTFVWACGKLLSDGGIAVYCACDEEKVSPTFCRSVMHK